jgi:hypothetical protein
MHISTDIPGGHARLLLPKVQVPSAEHHHLDSNSSFVRHIRSVFVAGCVELERSFGEKQ